MTVGRVSNVTWSEDKKMKSAIEKIRRGYRPRSGLEQKKTGYHGRKFRSMKKPVDTSVAYTDRPYPVGFTYEHNQGEVYKRSKVQRQEFLKELYAKKDD